MDLSNKMSCVQSFLTRLRNRCSEVDTLTSGTGIVFSVTPSSPLTPPLLVKRLQRMPLAHVSWSPKILLGAPPFARGDLLCEGDHVPAHALPEGAADALLPAQVRDVPAERRSDGLGQADAEGVAVDVRVG
jgi:hypothetical protein